MIAAPLEVGDEHVSLTAAAHSPQRVFALHVNRDLDVAVVRSEECCHLNLKHPSHHRPSRRLLHHSVRRSSQAFTEHFYRRYCAHVSSLAETTTAARPSAVGLSPNIVYWRQHRVSETGA